MQATIYGGSRKLYDMAHDFCLRGIGSHLEVFLPTLAAANGLKAGGLAVERHPALPGILISTSLPSLSPACQDRALISVGLTTTLARTRSQLALLPAARGSGVLGLP